MRFAEAYEECRDPVYGYLVYMTKDTTLAEDLSQEVFLRMFLHLDKFRGEASVRTWGLRIARNVFLSYAKKKQPLLLEEQEWEQLPDHHPSQVVKSRIYRARQKFRKAYEGESSERIY